MTTLTFAIFLWVSISPAIAQTLASAQSQISEATARFSAVVRRAQIEDRHARAQDAQEESRNPNEKLYSCLKTHGMKGTTLYLLSFLINNDWPDKAADEIAPIAQIALAADLALVADKNKAMLISEIRKKRSDYASVSDEGIWADIKAVILGIAENDTKKGIDELKAGTATLSACGLDVTGKKFFH